MLIGPTQEQDFTGGEAWSQIEKLIAAGAIRTSNEHQLLEKLQEQAPA